MNSQTRRSGSSQAALEAGGGAGLPSAGWSTSPSHEHHLGLSPVMKASSSAWLVPSVKAMAPPLQYSCLKNPMDGGAW